MMEIITPLSSIEMLRIADLMEATRLKGSILSYIAAHFGEVVHTDGYKLIVSESDCEIYGSLMNDIVTFVNQQATHKANCLGLVSSFIHVSGTVSHKHYETPQHPTPVPNQRVNSCTIM